MAVVSKNEVEKSTSKGSTAKSLLALGLVVLMVGIAVFISHAREEGNDVAVRSNLETIRIEIKEHGGIAEQVSSCAAGIFRENLTIVGARAAITLANHGGTLHCLAGAGSFMVVAERPHLGFFVQKEAYWCLDDVHLCPVSSIESVMSSQTCSCK